MKDANENEIEKVTHADILKAVEEIKKVVGWTSMDEHGQLIGIGIAGSLARLEKRVNTKFQWFDTTVKMVGAAVAAGGVFLGVIWWLAGPSVDQVFHPTEQASKK